MNIDKISLQEYGMPEEEFNKIYQYLISKSYYKVNDVINLDPKYIYNLRDIIKIVDKYNFFIEMENKAENIENYFLDLIDEGLIFKINPLICQIQIKIELKNTDQFSKFLAKINRIKNFFKKDINIISIYSNQTKFATIILHYV